VAIIAKGHIVAEGTTESLGERDAGEARIRFRLPEGFGAADLPVPATVDDRRVVITTTDEVDVLHRLTSWALGNGLRLNGLTVERLTLEDVYLRLTSSADAHAGEEAG
jgi:ABC-2 type transport system ATP-binding protein